MRYQMAYEGYMVLTDDTMIMLAGTLDECIAQAEKQRTEQNNVDKIVLRRIDDD